MGDAGRGEDQDRTVYDAVVVLGRAAHRAFATQGQEAFLEATFTGSTASAGCRSTRSVTTISIVRSSRCCSGRSRQENERWIAFRSHYGFEAWYCQPGHDGSHERAAWKAKGAGFAAITACRCRWSTPSTSSTPSLAAADDADDRRRIANRANTVGQDWGNRAAVPAACCRSGFETALTLTPRVDRYAQIMVRCNQYSVPARFIGHRVRVKLSASHVTVYDRTTVVARHPGQSAKAPKCWTWTTIWRSWPANPVPCRGHRTGSSAGGQTVHR